MLAFDIAQARCRCAEYLERGGDCVLLAVLSDIHANRQAFEACLKAVRGRGAERVVLLGDFVGYGADPEWVVDTAMELVANGAAAVRGNHDQAVNSSAET